MERKNITGEKLAALRKAKGLSQRELARLLQAAGYALDKNTITRMEPGKRRIFDAELKAICQLFAITPEELWECER